MCGWCQVTKYTKNVCSLCNVSVSIYRGWANATLRSEFWAIHCPRAKNIRREKKNGIENPKKKKFVSSWLRFDSIVLEYMNPSSWKILTMSWHLMMSLHSLNSLLRTVLIFSISSLVINVIFCHFNICVRNSPMSAKYSWNDKSCIDGGEKWLACAQCLYARARLCLCLCVREPGFQLYYSVSSRSFAFL